MITKQYIIKIYGSDKDHKEARQQIEELFSDLNQQLEAEMENYVVPASNSKFKWGTQPLNTLERNRLIF